MTRRLAPVLAGLLLAGCGGGSTDAIDAGGPTQADVVFVQGGSDRGLYLLSVATGRVTPLAEEGESPAWSPDGTQIAFTLLKDRTHGTSANRLWVVNADGSNRRRLVANETSEDPDWSPDGRQIAFTNGLGVSVVDVHGGSPRQIALEPSLPGPLDWSPDGKRIVVGGFKGIYIVSVDGSGVRQVTEQSWDGNPVWSPDGEWIAFDRSLLDMENRRRTGSIFTERSIYLMRPNGADIHRITRGAGPTWSPDGKRIAFSRSPQPGGTGSALYVIDASGGKVRPLTHTKVSGWSPDWRPAGVRSVTTSPKPTGPQVVVPSLARKEMTVRDLERALGRLGLRFSLAGEKRDPYVRWLIVTQVPAAGTKVPTGSVVQLAVFPASDPFAGRPFDSRVWRANTTCASDNPRGHMVADVMQRISVGTPRSRVLDLLGPPGKGSNDYPVGEWSGFRIDCDFLRVEFDEDGKVSRLYHWQS